MYILCMLGCSYTFIHIYKSYLILPVTQKTQAYEKGIAQEKWYNN